MYQENIFLHENNAKATHIVSAKNIYVFAIFQNRNFIFTLANNFVKFWSDSPEILTYKWINELKKGE